ncbi:PIN domain-containing protein [Nevskia soli]|jgi:predicted nucleic acid-binding protein|uniref:PIN domain-containing protein n=1 Tax=Nevskia soli TaxID=418856 RepID=UPI0015D91FAE|nr:PIN domain-containing protein [Nevskia soli]
MITLVNEYSAVLDACVLLPIRLCDLMLRLAEEPAMYSPKWSSEILAEVERNLLSGKFKLSAQKARYRLACMRSAFPEAMVDGYKSLIPFMPVNGEDRHVLAAAIMARADCIVTANLRHFPNAQIRDFGIEALHPDQFLTHQWDLDQGLVQTKIEDQARSYEVDLASHLEFMAKSVPNFAARVRRSS